MVYYFFFFNDTATTEIYTLSLHDALPISHRRRRTPRPRPPTSPEPRRCPGRRACSRGRRPGSASPRTPRTSSDRKSTRLNSSHANISYAVFCLKKKKKKRCLVLTQEYPG